VEEDAKPVELVALGHILCESIVFADGRRTGPVLGSPAAYSSAVAARLGVRAGIVTKLGPDAPPNLTQPLKEAGVDLSGIDHDSPVTTTNELIYAADGTKELKYLKQAQPITAGDIPDSYSQAPVFYVCTLDYDVPLETVSQITRFGKLRAVDLGGYGGAHVRRDTAKQKGLSSAALQRLISSFDIVKASDEDACLIFRGEGRLSDEEHACRLLQSGAKIGILTRGSKGSLVFTEAKKYILPALPGKVLDVTGGGDSYMAGFLVEFMRTGDPWQSGLFAAAVALCVIEKAGGVRAARMPTRAEASRRIPPGITPETL
jgi:sugar/nucleoside kinase (ribokinase family)